MARLDVDITTRLRDYELAVALSAGAETLGLVGPSGSGKTTILRGVAGLHRPDTGRIEADGRVWFDDAAGIDLAPEERSVGMVFQDYALFPHLTVRENVAFGADGDPGDLLDRLRIAHLADQLPAAISGGERQRVALARALARRPRVLLLDEPLSALDAHTRRQVRHELDDALRAAGLPALLVTHDFREAAVLCDRIAVLDEGRVLQVGSATELTAGPASPTVAALIGAELLRGHAEDGRVRLPSGIDVPVPGAAGDVTLALLPWRVTVSRDPGGVAGAVTAIASDGVRTTVRVAELVAEQPAELVDALDLRVGETVRLDIPAGAIRLL